MSERLTPVVIVRPDSGWTGAVTAVLAFAVRAWVAMLGLGALLPDAGISYQQAVLGLLVLGCANPSDYPYWTRARVRT